MDEQKISELVKQEVKNWFNNQQNQTSGYEYEKSFVECWQAIGQKVIQESMGKIPGSKNKKKTKDHSGRDRGAYKTSDK